MTSQELLLQTVKPCGTWPQMRGYPAPERQFLGAGTTVQHLGSLCKGDGQNNKVFGLKGARKNATSGSSDLDYAIDLTHMLHVWNIYQHLPHKSPSFVGKYTSTMVRIWVMNSLNVDSAAYGSTYIGVQH
jgi:hypothetical protein